jgi:alkylation response protein AidB-like acyl-CoA dehydrogenase
MDFSFTAEQLEHRRRVVTFAQESLGKDMLLRDKNSVFSHELWKKCADFGIQGAAFPKKFGGGDLDIVSTMLLMEGLGYGCKDSGLLFAMNGQMWTVQMPIMRFGTDAQREKYLPRLCRGESIGAHGMSEPGSGSDAFGLTTTARREDDHYILNGSKIFSTNAPEADVFLVFATVDKGKGFLGVTAFILERDFPGLRVGPIIDKMGLRTAHMAEIFFENCRVPLESRLGREGNGAAIFDDAIEWERSCILASLIGSMERQLEVCVAHAKSRKQFGKPIGKFQAVANRLVDMKVRMETARLILYRVAWMKNTRNKATMDAAIAKLYVSEAWVKSCLDAVQIHGGYGYTTDLEIERDLRDSVASTLYSGTSEIQKNIIARFMGL